MTIRCLCFGKFPESLDDEYQDGRSISQGRTLNKYHEMESLVFSSYALFLLPVLVVSKAKYILLCKQCRFRT
jgi:hypothetical protein